ncbi:MAG: hypothetical protein ACRYF4_07535 [Janthinobacterium lividum]
MARPVKWSRDLHRIREQAQHSRIETWSRQDLERLFEVGRASAQSLMKAVGNVQTIGGAHFVDRASLLSFLSSMIGADSVEEELRSRLADAEPAPRPKALHVTLPDGLRRAMLPDLPSNVKLSPGRIEITADSAIGMVEALVSLAMVMQNDLDRWHLLVTPRQVTKADEELQAFMTRLRNSHPEPA